MLLTGVTIGGGFDPDAQAFITAAGITDSTQQSSINTLALGLKANSLWTLGDAFYPFIGGTSTSCSYNLKNTAQYQITWANMLSGDFTANGITGNAFNKTGNTTINPTTLGRNDICIGTYCRLNITNSKTTIGTSTNKVEISPRDAGTFYMAANGTETNISNTDSRGLFTVSSAGTTTVQGYVNGSQLKSTSKTLTVVNENIHVLSAGGSGQFSAQNLAFAFVSKELTSTQVSNLYTLIQNFQTALGRNV